LAHSYGTLNGLYTLHNTNTDKRAKYIERYVPIAPPISGAFDPVLGAIGYANILDL